MSLIRTSIVKFSINNELDIILAHKRATQLCQLTGIRIADRTRFVTAISEICRNCIEYAKEGTIEFLICESQGNYHIESEIKDSGKGIEKVERFFNQTSINPNNRGIGLASAKKLVDQFKIDTSSRGTAIILGIRVPEKHPPINSIIVKGWNQHFNKEVPVSPYEEIKKQNIELLEITEQLRLRNLEAENQIEEIKTLNNKLSRSNGDLEAFAYTISHDLKSPINNLKMLVSFAGNANSPGKHKEYMDAIGTSVGKLEGIIDGLVEIINVQNGQKEAVKDVPFEEIVADVCQSLELEIRESNTAIYTHFDEASTIKYFEGYINSIILNLVNNAIKYRDLDKESKISISTKKDGSYVVLAVKDNGIGMNLDKHAESIFKPFTRFTRQAHGRGIGLHLVKTMVEKNDGRIEVESEVGKGSTFRLFLKEYI